MDTELDGITYEDKILDGWHRYRVAQHLGKESDLIFEGLSDVSPAEFVLAENLHRRHLSPAQSAAIVMKHTELLKHPGRPKEDKNVPRGRIKSAKEVAKEASEWATPKYNQYREPSPNGEGGV